MLLEPDEPDLLSGLDDVNMEGMDEADRMLAQMEARLGQLQRVSFGSPTGGINLIARWLNQSSWTAPDLHLGLRCRTVTTRRRRRGGGNSGRESGELVQWACGVSHDT